MDLEKWDKGGVEEERREERRSVRDRDMLLEESRWKERDDSGQESEATTSSVPRLIGDSSILLFVLAC